MIDPNLIEYAKALAARDQARGIETLANATYTKESGIGRDTSKTAHFFHAYKRWVQTHVFRQTGITWENDGVYTHHPPGSVAYDEFWDEEERRIKEGFEYMGQRISGLHYLYLNYCPIWNKAKRKYKFPDFRAVDAEWFLAIEKDLGLAHYDNDPSRPVGHVDAKSRQVGHSLKAVVPLLYFMNFVRGAKCYLGAVEDKYCQKTLRMYMRYHDHLYEYTDLGKGWLEKQKGKYYKTGYKDVIDGQEVEKGYLSELTIVSFNDTAEKGVGGGCDLFVIEEAGLFPDLLEAIGYIEPACKDGDLTTGNILVFGAAGDLENCKGYEKLCMDPVSYGFAGYPNIWLPGKAKDLVAYFIPNYSCRPPHMDADGNPDELKAITARDFELAMLKKKDFKKWAEKVSQYPNNIREMFDMRGHARFKKEIIEPHLALLRANAASIGTRVQLYPGEMGEPRYSLTVADHMQPILEYGQVNWNDTEGCPLIYEFPPPSPAHGLFIAAIDSYNQDDSTTESLGSIIIYKQANTLSGETGGRYIVAEYIGRPKAGKHEFYRICLLLMRLYNAKAMIENEDSELAPWFYNKGFDHMLADQPDIIRNILPNSRVKRTKGIHAAEALIIAAENKIQRYLEERVGYYYDDKGEVSGEKLGVTRIPSIYLLSELLAYTHDDNENYDHERTFGWLLMYEEELYTKPVEEEYDLDTADFLNNVFDTVNQSQRRQTAGYGGWETELFGDGDNSPAYGYKQAS